MDLEPETPDENAALKDLIRHCWVHNGYRDCGWQQMTTEQKRLYCQVIGRPWPEMDEATADQEGVCQSKGARREPREAYEDGQEAAKAGRSPEDNPYVSGGHERDTTIDDHLHYCWWSGYINPEEPYDPNDYE